jgi:hypothetical protein
MWTTAEDARRYGELTELLRARTEQDERGRAHERVDADDLALYLEWLGLARDVASNVTAFLDKSCPHTLRGLTYGQMASDFRWLSERVADAARAAMEAWESPLFTGPVPVVAGNFPEV